SVNNYLRNGSDWFYQFDITDGQIELNEKRIEQLLDKHRIYGRNQDELDLFYVLQLIGEKLDHVNKLTRFLQRDHRGRISFDIGTLFEYKGEKLVMRMDGFSSLLKKL
ncbi:MAG: hypothetical protein JXB17_08395, partial [Bacteroidales bacterium]|nr:hypothetical protein [Bacteroidales bacterium]